MKVYILITIAVAAATAVGVVVFFSSNNNNNVSSSLRRPRRLGLIYDPRTTILKPPLEQLEALPKCPLRDLSEFSTQTIGHKFIEVVPKTLEGSNCLFFDCNQDINECDNGDPTIYDGPKPPCCTHVLRDMSRIFDEEISSLGLDYVAGFGTLLGLRRADRFIPWSIDNDLVIEFPYMDLYLGEPRDDYKMFSVHKNKCLHLYRDVFPTYRKPVYNGQFAMNFPPNPDQLLRTYYGKRWRFPPSDEEKKEHGGRMCPYGPTMK